MSEYSQREADLIKMSLDYAEKNSASGAPGHNMFMLVAKLYQEARDLLRQKEDNERSSGLYISELESLCAKAATEVYDLRQQLERGKPLHGRVRELNDLYEQLGAAADRHDWDRVTELERQIEDFRP